MRVNFLLPLNLGKRIPRFLTALFCVEWLDHRNATRVLDSSPALKFKVQSDTRDSSVEKRLNRDKGQNDSVLK